MERRPRLWLVDDDPEIAVIVGMLCKRHGFDLARFKAVGPAWAALAEQGSPELMLLDLNLPGESGVDFLRRRAEAGGGPPVSLFCQPGLHRDIAAGWAAGADFLLAKDLVADPPAWARRVGEILAHPVAKDGGVSLEWVVEGNVASGVSWGKLLCQEIEQLVNRPLGGVVLTQVIRRCLMAGFGPDAADCLHPNSGRISALALARPASPDQARLILASLVDQVARLSGHEAAAGCRRRLQAVWAGRLRERR